MICFWCSWLFVKNLLKHSRSELQSVVRSGGAIWWMLTGWRPGVVDWGSGVFAGCLPRVELFVSTCNGWPHVALQHHWLLLINCHFNDCKAWLVRFPCYAHDTLAGNSRQRRKLATKFALVSNSGICPQHYNLN